MLTIGKCDRAAKTGETISIKLGNGKTVQAKVISNLTNLTPIVGKDEAGNWYAWGGGNAAAYNVNRTISRSRPRKVITDTYPFMVGSKLEAGQFWRSGNDQKKELKDGQELIGFANLGKGKFIAFIKTSPTTIAKIEKGQETVIECEDAAAMTWLGGPHLWRLPTVRQKNDASISTTQTANPAGRTEAAPLLVDGNNEKNSQFSLSKSRTGSEGFLSELITDSQTKTSSVSGLPNITTYPLPQQGLGINSWAQYYCKSLIDIDNLAYLVPPNFGTFNPFRLGKKDFSVDWAASSTQDYNYNLIQKTELFFQQGAAQTSQETSYQDSRQLDFSRTYETDAVFNIVFLFNKGLGIFDTWNSYPSGLSIRPPAHLETFYTYPTFFLSPIVSSVVEKAEETYHSKTEFNSFWEYELPIVDDLKEIIYSESINKIEFEFNCNADPFRIDTPRTETLLGTTYNYFLYIWARNGVREDNFQYKNRSRSFVPLIGGETSFFYEINEINSDYQIKNEYPNYNTQLEWVLDRRSAWDNYLFGRNNIYTRNPILFEYTANSALISFLHLGIFARFYPEFPEESIPILGTTKKTTIDAAYTPSGGAHKTAYFYNAEIKHPVKVKDSFLFIFSHSEETTVLERDLDMIGIGYENSQYYDFPTRIKHEINATFDSVRQLSGGTPRREILWRTTSSNTPILERTNWDDCWQESAAAQMFFQNGKKYLCDIELNINWQDVERQIESIGVSLEVYYHKRNLIDISFTVINQTEIDYFCYENILEYGKAAIWSPGNCYWLLKYYLQNDLKKANLVKDNLYIAQPLTLDEVRQGKKKNFVDCYHAAIEGEGEAAEIVWRWQGIEKATITGLGKDLVSGDFISYY